MFGRILADIDRPFPFLKARMYENMGLTEKLKGKKKNRKGSVSQIQGQILKTEQGETIELPGVVGRANFFTFFSFTLLFVSVS